MSASPSKLKQDILAYAHSLGFERAGVTAVTPLESAEQALGTWLEEGRAGGMDYMQKNWQRRARPAELLPGAKSLIALAVNYYDGPTEALPQEAGRVARYAWGKDYHRSLEKRLDALVRYIQAMHPEAQCKTFLDTGPLLERAVAQKAGLGFIGKNTMLITRGMGSWIFLASVLTTLELPVDGPDTRSCGSCTRCIDACPTQAITEPYQLDARRCIAYLTIESKEPIPDSLSTQVGEWVFGCDICQDVCPHNTRLPLTPIPEFQRSAGAGPFLSLETLLSFQSDVDFEQRFAGTPLKRAKRSGLQRNAKVVQKNQLSKVPLLERPA